MRGWPAVTSSTELARAVVGRAGRERGPRGRAGARVAQRAARLRGVRRRRGRAAPAAHADRRADRRLPGPRADQGRLAGRGDLHVRAPPSPTCTRRCSRRTTPASPMVVGHRRPAGPAARHRRQPDHRPGRDLRPAGRAPSTWPAGLRLRPARSGRTGGSLHLNVQLDDPLVPPDRWTPDRTSGADWTTRRRRRHDAAGDTMLASGPRTVVVAGDDAGPPARVLAAARPAGRCWPSRPAGRAPATTRSATYRLLLGGRARPTQVERVVVFGHPTLSRPVQRLLARDDVEVLERPSPGLDDGRSPSTARRRPRRRRAPTTPPGSTAWQRGRRSGRPRQLDALLAAEPGFTPYDVAGAVSRALPPGGLLVVGASNPIRDLDLMATRYDVGGRRKVIANRGLSGIDGTVSTAIGAALGRHARSRSLALIGDVTFLHDANGLVLGPRRAAPDLTIVVVNDDGGSIFATLEQGAPEYADALRAALRHPARRRPGRALRRRPGRRTAGRLARRARAGAGQPQRRHRGGRGRLPPRQPPRARRAHPRARP